jgi:hypothetical protein
MRDGRVWRIRFQDRPASIPDRKGCLPIAKLLKTPGQAISAIILEGGDPGAVASLSFQSAMDNPAFAASRKRLSELATEIREAEKDQNEEEHKQLEAEKQQILGELKRASGKDGRKRRLGGEPPEREAAKRVEQNILNVAKDLADELPAFAEHVKNHIHKQGGTLIYQPAGLSPDWTILC